MTAMISEYELVKIVRELFDYSGFQTIQEYVIQAHHTKHVLDLVAQKDTEKYCIEVKTTTTPKLDNLVYYHGFIEYYLNIAYQEKCTPILIITSIIPDKVISQYEAEKGLIVIDIRNLLYYLKGTPLQDRIAALLPFSTDSVEVKKGLLDLSASKAVSKKTSQKAPTPMDEVHKCKPGKTAAKKFEKACYNVLKYIFAEDLSLWKEQPSSNKKLYYMDTLCRIKDNNNKTFWKMMETYFHSKYIVFEYKNYTKTITQEEIYTTEKYLYSKALRNVAIMIARNGSDENADWAAKGCLRENGKLILPISVDDLETMYNMKVARKDPSEFLLDKLDTLLTKLEK